MDGIDYWRMADELTVIQAALLVCGYDPTVLQDEVKNSYKDLPDGYEAIKHSLKSAISTKKITAKETQAFNDYDGEYYIDDDLAMIDVDDLKKWLLSKGVREHFFFFPIEPEGEFLSKNHPRYAPKLAAAVRAWQALDGKEMRGTTPKKAIMKWLRLHATEYELTDDEGKPLESAIQEIGKIANWNPKGGAPSTPTSVGSAKPDIGNRDSTVPSDKFSVPKKKEWPKNRFDLDSDVPF